MGPVFHFRFHGAARTALLRAAALALPAAIHAVPLDISVIVSDKLGKPVPGATVCLEADNSQCAQTLADGRTTLAATVGIHAGPLTEGSAAADRISFSVRGGSLRIHAPEAQTARLARFDARGRAWGAERVLRLHAGVNALEWSESGAGLGFFRVTTPGFAFTGKVLSLSSGGDSESGRQAAMSTASTFTTFTTRATHPTLARVAALGKVATANLHTVIIAKTGYRSVTYRPRTDRDTGVAIRLSAESDSGIQYTGVIRAKVDVLDTANHVINYTYNETRCSGSTQNTVELHSSLPFWVRDGKWYFPAGNCQGVMLAKETSGYFGSWKTVGVRDYPAGLLPVKCDPVKDSVVTGVINLFFIHEGGGWDIDLREDSLTIRIRRELCPGNQAVFNPSYYDGKQGRPLLAKNTCREVEFRNPADEPGTYAFSRVSDSLRGAFTFKDKACPTPGVSLNIDSNGPKICPEPAQVPLSQDTTFQRCVFNTGFMPATP